MTPRATPRRTPLRLPLAALALLAVSACGGPAATPPADADGAVTHQPSVPVTAPAAPTGSAVQATNAPVATSAAACIPPPDGIVAWWPGENDATDAAGSHDGTLKGGAGFTAGEVGQAFAFD